MTLGSGPGETAATAGGSAAQAAETESGAEARARIGEEVEFAGGDSADLCARTHQWLSQQSRS